MKAGSALGARVREGRKRLELSQASLGDPTYSRQYISAIELGNDNYPPAAATYRHYRKLIASESVDFRDSDVREIESFPSCDVVLGCYPCQSFTMGGPRLPSSDPRTLLYREFIRCLKTSQP